MIKNKDSIKCDNCKTDFIPDKNQRKFIDSSIKKKMTFIMLECKNCGMTFPFNPLGTQEILAEDLPLRTPISGCHGFVSFIDSDENDIFYGCGESGAIWRHKKNLERDIVLIIKKYPHRELCYVMTENGWEPNSEEPDNMDELIDKEMFEDIDDFERD